MQITRQASMGALIAERVCWQERLALALKAQAVVDALPMPSAELAETFDHPRGPREAWRMGEALIYTLPCMPFDEERRRALEARWKRYRYAERSSHSVAECERRLEDNERRLLAARGPGWW